MTPSPRQTSENEQNSFLRYLGWTILLGIVFGVGLIVGRQWVDESVPPFVSVGTSSGPRAGPDAGSTSSDTSSAMAARPDASSSRPSVELSFYDRLSDGFASDRSPPRDRSSETPLRTRAVEARTSDDSPPSASLSGESRGGRRGEPDVPPESARYTLQISAHRELEYAKRRMEALQKKGLDPYLVTAEVEGEGTYYRVRLGAFGSMEEAEAFERAVERKRGVDASIMPF